MLNHKMSQYQSQSWMKVKVAKGCWNRWNGLIDNWQLWVDFMQHNSSYQDDQGGESPPWSPVVTKIILVDQDPTKDEERRRRRRERNKVAAEKCRWVFWEKHYKSIKLPSHNNLGVSDGFWWSVLWSMVMVMFSATLHTYHRQSVSRRFWTSAASNLANLFHLCYGVRRNPGTLTM